MDEIERLFDAVGSADYVGEAVTQVEHALQAAKCASDCGADDETVAAALLHDVGHMLALQDKNAKMMTGGLGAKDHERTGASWLVTLGFGNKTAQLVRRHVDAKRYLCFANPAYHAKLSPASAGTLLQQGGPMDAAEASAFERDPLKETILKMRTWDEAAKVVNPSFFVPPLSSYRALVDRCIARQRAQLAATPFAHYKLSAEQLQGYERDGFIVLRDLLGLPEERQRVVDMVHEIQAWPETPGKWMCYFENKLQAGTGAQELMLCRTENFLPYHAEMRALLAEDGPVLDALHQLMNEPAVLFKEKINYKLAGGGGFPAHQDAPAFTSFGQRNHLTLNIAIDAATPENGCLQVAPGHHKRGLFPQDPVHHGLRKEEEQALDNWVDVPLAAGDVLIFSSWLPHRSGPNLSAKSRSALYVTYNGAMDGCYRDLYYEVKSKAFPQRCERDPTKDYSEAAKVFNIATPIVT